MNNIDSEEGIKVQLKVFSNLPQQTTPAAIKISREQNNFAFGHGQKI